MDKTIELALRTWYPKDHELHFKPHHPLGKLVGEWGELLDDYMKSIYKPGYVWQPIDELGDIWYYLRILCYQKKYSPEVYDLSGQETDRLIAIAIDETVKAFLNDHTMPFYLDVSFTVLLQLLDREGVSLDKLTTANWEKLKPGSIRGDEWMKARPIELFSKRS